MLSLAEYNKNQSDNANGVRVMFVLVDMKWMSNDDGYHFPTQLAAIKTDEHWNTVDTFKAYIRPYDTKYHKWNHVAYTGGTPSEFKHADKASKVFGTFEQWLNEGDILLWWYNESNLIFRKIFRIILNRKESHEAIIINRYVYRHLRGHSHYHHGDVYMRAQEQGIDFDEELINNAFNDVCVMQTLLNKIAFPQGELLQPLEKVKGPAKFNPQPNLPLQYDPATNTIHIKVCELLASSEIITKGYDNWKTPIRKRYRPCDCCKEEYKAAFRQKNFDIIKRTNYVYFYTPNSKAFHKPICSRLFYVGTILGTNKFDTATKSGRTPCKICKPTRKDAYDALPMEVKIAQIEKKIQKGANPIDKKAMNRQKVAVKERKRLLKEKNLTQEEREDIYTLTQPRFAFWVGKGYQSFHLRSCPRLNGVTNLRGFETYKEAVSAGYTPCRQCKPTSKHDATVSVPFTNRVRLHENLSDIKTKCEEAGYTFNRDKKYIYIKTPVGKWKIKTAKLPVKLEHINLVIEPDGETYHEQPRIFLSFMDTFEYIKRHDDNLESEKEEGKLFKKLLKI